MSNGSIQGLPLTNTWVGVAPCSTDPSSGTVSIIDNITITGTPGAVSSSYWSVALNDGASPPNFNISRLDGAGNVLDKSMVVSGVDGTITFNDDVILAEDPVEPMQAATKHYVDTVVGTPAAIPNPSTTNPLMDGVAAPGVAVTYARGDHVHPIDTSRYDASNPSGYQTAAQVTATLAPYALTTSVPSGSSTAPLMDGVAGAGAGATWARADHVHPSDTSRLPLTGGTLTGPLTPAGIVGTTTNNNAAAGQVGEFINSSTVSPGVTLSTSVSANVTSISLTAGDWDVWGEAWIAVGTGGATVGGAAINTVSATFPAAPSANSARGQTGASVVQGLNVLSGVKCRVSLSVTTTVYLMASVTFPSGTTTAYGSLSARRMR